MLVIIGLVVVIGCVLGGYVAMGGSMAVLNQPFELVIIGGAGVGAFLIANTGAVLSKVGGGFGAAVKGSKYKKASYVELLTMLYQIFKLSKSKGMLALEPHIENPHESDLFAQFPNIQKDHHIMDFLCDYLRLLTLGTDNAHELEALMDEELETHHQEQEAVASAVQTMADGFPALGIVAAVLGVIKTMTYITAPPEVLGGKIAAALVGTFLGIFLCYGMFGPVASAIKQVFDAEGKIFLCIKAGLLAHVSGYAPAISVEFARKSISEKLRPGFTELEEEVSKLPNP